MPELHEVVDERYVDDLNRLGFLASPHPQQQLASLQPNVFKERNCTPPDTATLRHAVGISMGTLLQLENLLNKVPPLDHFYTVANLEYYFTEYRATIFNQIMSVLQFCGLIALWQGDKGKTKYFHDQKEKIRVAIGAKILNTSAYRTLAKEHAPDLPVHVADAIDYRKDLMMIQRAELDDAYRILAEAEAFLVRIHTPLREVMDTLTETVQPIRALIAYCLSSRERTLGEINRAVDEHVSAHPEQINGSSSPALAAFRTDVICIFPQDTSAQEILDNTRGNPKLGAVSKAFYNVALGLIKDTTGPQIQESLETLETSL